MNKSRLIKINYKRKDKRGLFVEVMNGVSWKTVSFGEMKKGAVMGNHFHKKTRILFFMIKGEALVKEVHVKTNVRDSFSLGSQEGYIIEKNILHSIQFKKKSLFLIAKSNPYIPESPDTYYRKDAYV